MERHGRLKGILAGTTPITLYLEFLYSHNHADLQARALPPSLLPALQVEGACAGVTGRQLEGAASLGVCRTSLVTGALELLACMLCGHHFSPYLVHGTPAASSGAESLSRCTQHDALYVSEPQVHS